MNSYDILCAIVRYRLWVHPAGLPYTGWTACMETAEHVVWNAPTLYAAVEQMVALIEKEVP